MLFVILPDGVITTGQKIRMIANAPPDPPALHRIDTVSSRGVNRDNLAPAQHPQETAANYTQRLPGIAEVRIPPKFPKCGIGLEERKAMLFGHIRQCVSCGFRKRNRDTFMTEAGRAGKIWKGRAGADTAAAVAAASASPAVTADLRNNRDFLLWRDH